MKKSLCKVFGHRWRLLSVNVSKVYNLRHLHPLAGADADCLRCGEQWRDARSRFFGNDIRSLAPDQVGVKKPTEYKLRAECQLDLAHFLQGVPVNSFAAESSAWSDMTATFTSTLSLGEIRSELSKIVDGHVMLESLNYAERYTGERYFT